MNKQVNRALVIFPLILTLLTGCVTAELKLTQASQPVLLGNVDRIGGTDPARGRLKAEIDIKSSASDNKPSEVSGNTAGVELLIRLRHPRDIDTAEEKIVIQKVYFGSSSLFIVFIITGEEQTDSWAGVTGAIYENTNTPLKYKKTAE
jgi:hypothetical protein